MSNNPKPSEINMRNRMFDAQYEDKRYCWGCGSPYKPLSRAHIVRYSSIPYPGAKRALQMDIDNMAYLCMDNPQGKGCHSIWDDNSWEIEEQFWEIHNLACFVDFMKIIKDKDPDLYKKRIDTINYWIEKYG